MIPLLGEFEGAKPPQGNKSAFPFRKNVRRKKIKIFYGMSANPSNCPFFP
jgi:hypothetical protein